MRPGQLAGGRIDAAAARIEHNVKIVQDGQQLAGMLVINGLDVLRVIDP
jgi:hypothetical protein